LVQFSVVGPGYSYSAGIGRVVDLGEKIGPNVTLAEVTDPAWFAPVEDEPEPTVKEPE
jgi:hypothetical protein